MRKILLTRSSMDEKFADELGRLLTKLKFEVWIDISGKRWEFKTLARSFPEALAVFDQCELLIVVISPTSVDAPKIINDWQYFLDQSKPIIPVIWQAAEVPEPLQREQYVDFSGGDYKTALTRLRAELKPLSDEADEGKLHILEAKKPIPVPRTDNLFSNMLLMWRCTHPTRLVVSRAWKEAVRFGHSEIGVDHVLFGMLLEEDGVAGRVLREFGVQVDQVEALLNIPDLASSEDVSLWPDLAEDTKRLLQLSIDEARHLGLNYADTEHLLLGLARLNQKGKTDILTALGLDPVEIRHRVHKILSEPPEQKPPASPDDPDNPPVSPV